MIGGSMPAFMVSVNRVPFAFCAMSLHRAGRRLETFSVQFDQALRPKQDAASSRSSASALQRQMQEKSPRSIRVCSMPRNDSAQLGFELNERERFCDVRRHARVLGFQHGIPVGPSGNHDEGNLGTR